ncbi:hypothetical protein D1114_07215 [Cereibacter sphaeroides]|uniref:Uncharacterized protein n=1 Tax=Cereibacter sphaeroides TaxID=1063 RepID=A0AAX1UNP1_CERSP|nr:hypothetical protein [Cereibacter sphaeroides]RHZ96491.1 hypothetical protein D1114_07215 [Cereibacter sphaeroides]
MSALDDLRENDISLDRIVWIGGTVGGFSDDDFFEDVILELCDRETTMRIHESVPPLWGMPELATDDEESWLEAAAQNDINGFLVQASTPIPKYFKDGCGFMSSWGYTAHTWIYVARPEDAVGLAVEWRNALHDAKKAEAQQ